jgi:hypothetical protein
MAAEISWASNIRKPHSSITCRGVSKPQPSWVRTVGAGPLTGRRVPVRL